MAADNMNAMRLAAVAVIATVTAVAVIAVLAAEMAVAVAAVGVVVVTGIGRKKTMIEENVVTGSVMGSGIVVVDDSEHQVDEEMDEVV